MTSRQKPSSGATSKHRAARAVSQLMYCASHYKPAEPPAQLRAVVARERWKFPQVSVMVLPPLLGQGLHLALFSKINRRIPMETNTGQKMTKHFENLYQVSGIAHWETPREFVRKLLSVLDDPKPFKDGALPCSSSGARGS
jgi:hypothetical protein